MSTCINDPASTLPMKEIKTYAGDSALERSFLLNARRSLRSAIF
jgi:hypothetical protein